MTPDLMRPDEVAEISRKSVETLRWMRQRSTGPRFFKLGRNVLYAREDVEAWIADARANTGDAA